MDAERIDNVTGWDEASYADGYAGLRRLADRDFSGAVTDGAAWLFMLNGRVVGVIDGDLDGFADASGTAYEAPHDALPLLYAMQELGGETRAQYYTNDTPLSEADTTLSAGNFTGYVELSENVLSGDYYVAYYGGESLACAFVGNSRTLKTGEEAFDLADDEVGIYRVVEVDLDVREVPDAEPNAADAANAANTADADALTDDATDAADEDSEDERTAAETAESDRAASDDGDSDHTAVGPIDPDPSAATGSSTAASEPTDAGAGDPDPAQSAAESDSETVEAGRRASEADADARTDDGPTDEAPGETTGGRADETADDATHETAGDADADADVSRTAAPSNRRPEPSRESDAETAADESTSGARPPEGWGDAPAETREAGHVAAQQSEATSESTPADPDDDVFSEEEEWREARSIPALDPTEAGPGRTRPQQSSEGSDGRAERSSGRAERGGQSTRNGRGGSSEAASGDRSSGGDGRDRGDRTEPRPTGTGSEADPETAADRKQAVSERPSVQRSQLQRQVNRLEQELDRAETEREQAAEEREAVAAERDEYREEAERLESRVAELESELKSVRGDLREARAQLPDGDRTMSPADALAGTNLFVRYESQGGATLEKAHDGEVSREELAGNLRLEYHTSFEDEGVVVDGEPYEEFLRGTMEYGFTRWVAEELPFEVRETGNVGALADLYDAIPEIDRAEIGGSASIRRTEDGEETREQRTFDLVLRDRMGTPLFVADLNDSREPTPERTLEELVEHGSHLAESDDAFAAAFAVTSSFFEPGALETADDATGGGILSRSKRKSYVKIARKRGYHLCLAESRDGGFHLTVPEL